MKISFSGVGLRFAVSLAMAAFVAVNVWAQEAGPVHWTKLSGTAVDISINADGQAYVAATDGTPWRWDRVEQRWRRMSGQFVRMTAAEGNRPWAVNADGVVMRYNGLWWENKDTGVADVAADTAGNVYIAKTDGSIKKWYALRSEWQPVDGAARRIALDSSGHLWAVTAAGTIRSFDGKTWITHPGRAIDIGVGGTNTVVIVDTDGAVRTLNASGRRWDTVAGVENVVAVAVTPDGGPWAVTRDGSILATSFLISEVVKVEEDRAPEAVAPSAVAPVSMAPVSVAPVSVAPVETAPLAVVMPVDTSSSEAKAAPSTAAVGSIDPAAVSFKGSITFVNTRKNAASIAIGKDGSVFALDVAGKVLRWSNARKTFDSFPGTLVRIAVDAQGNPWGISALGRVFHHTGKVWQQISGATGSDIAIGAYGTVLITDASGALYRLNVERTRFDKIAGSGVLVAVGPDGAPWTVRADKLVQRCDTSPCTVLPQKAVSISVGPDGSVWVVSDRNLLMRLKADGKTFEVVPTAGHTPSKVAVGPNGYPWVISATQLALASNYFERDEDRDRLTAAATAGDTVGTGAIASVVSTSSTSSFVFTKNLTFQSVSFTSLSGGSCPQLETDPDGLIWAHNSGGNLEQYDAAKRKFVKRSTAFDGWDHTAFDVAPDGAIWASTLNPHTGLYRAYQGVTKQYLISGSTYFDDISVASDGTVYVVVSMSGPRYLYYKSPGSEVFKRFSTYNNVRQVSVGAGGDIWISDADIEIRRWNGSSFERPENITFSAAKISASKVDGTLYVKKNGSADLYKWNPTNKSFDKINNLTVDTFAVDGDGRPWICRDTTPVIERAKD